MSDRLLPSTVGLNGEFYAFLAHGELRLQRCTACGTWRHPPRYRCAHCGSHRVAWEPASGRGRVYSWTVDAPRRRPRVHAAVRDPRRRARRGSAPRRQPPRSRTVRIGARSPRRRRDRARIRHRRPPLVQARPSDRRSEGAAEGSAVEVAPRTGAGLKDEVAMDGRRARIVLGVGNDAGPAEIRRAFRARALVTHPDHGGDRAAFAELDRRARSRSTRSSRRSSAPCPAAAPRAARRARSRLAPARPRRASTPTTRPAAPPAAATFADVPAGCHRPSRLR